MDRRVCRWRVDSRHKVGRLVSRKQMAAEEMSGERVTCTRIDMGEVLTLVLHQAMRFVV